MVKFRQLLLMFLIVATLVAGSAKAQTNLTQILDTITNPDGTLFNGTVVITWNGYSGSGSGTVSRLSTSARVYNGALSVLLVPTTTASPGTYYLAVYTSSNGTTSWTETWQVPPSTTALTLAAVRQTSTEGTSTSSGGSGSSGSSGGQYATLPIAISSVTNLASTLSTINTTLGTVQSGATTLSNTVSGLNTTVNGMSSTLSSQGATLSNLSSTVGTLGTTVSGLNSTVTSQSTTLTNLSSTVGGLSTTVTGLSGTVGTQGTTLTSLTNTVAGLNTTVSGLSSTVGSLGSSVTTQGNSLTSLSNTVGTLNTTVTSQGTSISSLSSNLGNLTTTVSGNTNTLNTVNTAVNGLSTNVSNLTSMVNGLNTTVNSLSSVSSSAVFIDDETPSGTANGTNAGFSLANPPAPAASLALFRNGLAMQAGVDYMLAGSTITFKTASIPQSGDILLAYYRIAGTGSTVNFSDNETPGGTINGTNVAFTLASAPNPAASLRLYRNGVLVAPGIEYTLSGSTITFTTTRTPQTGDSLAAFYRH